MKPTATIIALGFALTSVTAHPGLIARHDYKNPISKGDLQSGKLGNMPQSDKQFKCEDHTYSNDDIFNTTSYAHNLQKSNSPTQKPSGNKGKTVPYPHPNSPEKSNNNKFGNSDVSLKD